MCAPWQREAIGFADTVGELAFAQQWMANALSRVTLRVMEQGTDDEGQPALLECKNPTAIAALNSLFYGASGQSQMMAAFGHHLTTPGESWLVGVAPEDAEGNPTNTSDDDLWRVLSVLELSQSGSRWEIDRGDGNPERYEDGSNPDKPAEALFIRIWRPHPMKWVEATSPCRAAIPILRELEGLTQQIASTIDSRLTGAGVLLVPTEMTFGTPLDPSADPNDLLGQRDFIAEMAEAFAAARADQSSAAAQVPILLKVPGNLIEKVQHIRFSTDLSEQAQNMRTECIRRLALSLDMPPEVLLGQADTNHWCVDSETEVLTRRGWVGVDDFVVGDEVLALDHRTGSAAWTATDDLYVADVVDEPMRALETRSHSSLTTMNHRWATVTPWGNRRWTTTVELNAHDAIPTAAPVSDVPLVAKYDDALVETLAWYWTEGSVRHEGRLGQTVTIAQSHTANPHRVARIRAALTAAFGASGFTEYVQSNRASYGGPVTVFRLRRWAGDVLVAHAPRKHVRAEVVDALTLAQLRLFIDTSCEGDGHHWRDGRRDIWQRDPSMLDAYERACILAGYAVSRRPSHDGGTTVYALRATQVRPVKAAEQMSRTTQTGATDEVVAYTGRVWCPTVPERHTYLARRHGRTFYTGNSAWLIDDDAIKMHVEPLVELITDALTTQFLWLALGDPEKDPTLRRYVIVGDTSELRQRPNRTAEAQTLWGTMSISNAALLRECGFEESDVPDSAEVTARLVLLTAMGKVDPQLAASALAQLGVSVEPVAPPHVSEDAPAGTPATVPEATPAAPASPAPMPSGNTADSRTPPAPEQAAALQASAELLVVRALERANARLNQRRRTRKPITDHEAITAALSDAWVHVDRQAALLGVEGRALQVACDDYVRDLLVTGRDHDPRLLSAKLRLLVLDRAEEPVGV